MATEWNRNSTVVAMCMGEGRDWLKKKRMVIAGRALFLVGLIPARRGKWKGCRISEDLWSCLGCLRRDGRLTMWL